MGCGASVDGAVAPPPPGPDPLEELLQQIREKQNEFKRGAAELEHKQAELRYLKTTIVKLDWINRDMQADLEQEQIFYSDLKYHIADFDAYDLREASVGFGTDESRMANIIVARMPENMIITDQLYQTKYNRTLEDQIRGENKTLLGMITGSLTHFGRFLCYRCMPQPKRDAFLIHKCMAGMGCSDKILVEILSTRTNAQLQAAAEVYAQDHDGESMAERIMKETGGFGKKWYGKWIDALVEFDRDESDTVPDDVAELAQKLYDAGAGMFMRTDEQVFLDILAKANEPTCKALAEAYEALEDSKRSLAEDVEKEMGGDLEFAVLARVRPKLDFLSIRIYKACKGWGTDEECIGRVIACLPKNDVVGLETRYNEIYADEKEPFNSFRDLLTSELSGSFLDSIISLLDTIPPKGHCNPEFTYEPEAVTAAEVFKGDLEGLYNGDLAAQFGRTPMNGPIQLVGVDPVFVRVSPYDYDIEAPEPVWEDEDRSHLFPPEDPGDVESAQALLNQLVLACQQVETSAQVATMQIDGLRPGHFDKAYQMRYKDQLLGQHVEDDSAMLAFCASRDADLVHEAVDGWGTDEDKLIRVLCSLQKQQLAAVDQIYMERYEKSLRDVTDSELGGLFEGNLRYFMKCLITPQAELDAELLRESMAGLGTDDQLLCEVICTRSNKELVAAKEKFVEVNGKSVEQWVDGDTSGTYQGFLMACLTGRRDEAPTPNRGLATEQAQKLAGAGLSGGDLDSGTVTDVLAFTARAQMEAIKEAYASQFNTSLVDAIKENVSGGWQRAMLARVYDKPTYYAIQCEGAMKGWGTDEKVMSRTFGCNTKATIRKIATRYEELFGRSLHDAIVGDISGNFQKAVLTMIYAEAPGAAADPGEEGEEAPPPEEE